MSAFERDTLVQRATGVLAAFNAAGVLGQADVHTATAVCRMGGEPDASVGLALALTVRALRMGSVCIDLDNVHAEVLETAAAADDDAGVPSGPGVGSGRGVGLAPDESADELAALPWPDPATWRAACAASPIVAPGAEAPDGRPLRIGGRLLYLERYWQQEELVRREIGRRLVQPPPTVDEARLAGALARLFDGAGLDANEPDRQRLAAAVAASSWLSVIAGGPGTGKTTTVARLLALLADQPVPPRRVALAAPTGKAAARLGEAVHAASSELAEGDRARIGTPGVATLHRLLGWQRATPGRFLHHAGNHLPYDVVVVDEVSMVSLTMMARLLEAVGPTTRLVLVGDPDQLSSVEAGVVLADITEAPGIPDPRLATTLERVGVRRPEERAPVHGVVRLTHTWRYGEGIGRLARAVRAADADGVEEVLRAGLEDVVFVEGDAADPRTAGLDRLIDEVQRQGRAAWEAAAAGPAGTAGTAGPAGIDSTVSAVSAALAALDQHRLLCAHRSGPYGMSWWGREAERWLAQVITGYGEGGEWYVGRPVLVTENDYDLNLYNGDTGIVVATRDGPRVAFARGADPVLVAPVRLDAVQTVHAMTVHKAQGSQFGCVSFVVPPVDSPLLTRELLYTAVSRASRRVQIFGTLDAVRRAVERPANRASGLRHRLAPGDPPAMR